MKTFGRWVCASLVLGVLTGTATPPTVAAQNLPLPPLPYAYDALEPYIDEQTMRIHHLKHHQAYTDNLNKALATMRGDPELKHLAKMGIDKLLQHLDEVPPRLRGQVRNHGGGYVNHDQFWRNLSPNGAGEPGQGSALQHAIEKSFGSLDGFKTVFSEACLGVFGSGWCWLCFNTEAQTLSVETTSNQDSPTSAGLEVIIALDVWEHAYYLKHQNRRKDYLEAIFAVLDWQEADARLRKVLHDATKEDL
ncbi:Superoxide dismutase Mn, mitochondrial [Hondaea fermentalgiana]|uniref:Superoxide dismutase n=1 Tax=Hondaea fermentalgiana TaxID=2315210 RepID=A0A2R5GX41_9STRA|nr:Superoxide dismutase Mn, mitochondrial [Hondaea fermentalgiana]|eukprot:GBG33253.1 Superoxide dismutase Mn, mitochondrial [Hondaea fermentalgiana]